MAYDIITHGVEKYIEQIRCLGDKHRDTLGFLPAGSFKEYIDSGNLFCAVSQDRVIAYVLFRYRKRSNSILLVHVCVSSEVQHKGIGAVLINTIIEQFPLAYYIEARCRRDYCLDEFWKKAGFNVVIERSGRKIEGSILTVWRRTMIKKDLLDLIIQQSSEDRIIAALDTNIVITLCDDADSSVQCLFDDKIRSDVLYCITSEMANEINKKEDDSIRAKHLQFISRFQQLSASSIDSDLVETISKKIDPNRTHIEDVRHIVYCIQAELVDAFITNDEWIHAHKTYFAEEYNLLIFHPEEFWQYMFSDVDQDIVSAKIIGSKYKFSALDSYTLSGTVALYQAMGKKKTVWNAEIRSSMVDKTVSTWLLLEEEHVIGLISIKHHLHYIDIIHLVVDVSEHRRVYRFLLKALIEKVLLCISQSLPSNQCIALLLSQPISDSQKSVIVECGFWELPSGAIRFIASGVQNREKLLRMLDEYIGVLSNNITNDGALRSIASFFENCQETQLECYLSPAVVSDLPLPTFIISIDPKYAINLFDEKLANANISFFDNPFIYAALSSTNAYYTRSSIRFTPPCRILWYVKHDDRYTYSGSIRACSIMLAHRYDKTNELFKRYGQFGVLEWEDVKDTNKIGVFTFSNTVLFNNPIPYKELTDIASSCQSGKIQLQGPHHISDILAQRLLSRGLE